MNKLTNLFIVAAFAFVFAACSNNNSLAPVNLAQNNQTNTDQSNKINNNKPTETAAVEDKRTAMHKQLESLVGEWNLDKSNYIALGGTAEKPIVSKDLICKREFIEETGKMFIKDVTTGTFGGAYYRLGILAYSPADEGYEWNTIDNFNPMMMTYKGLKGSANAAGDISMVGEFTDSGIFSDKSTVGKTIKQRTVIKIETTDRNTMEIYFTLPGKTEILADRVICTRRR